jgi:2-polyprenyl-6-methoxyphenol hydroxylase-like FAD-dependent oxidoreductase
MFGKHKTDVLIAGAGPVGMFTALTLAEHGVSLEILDAQWRTAARSYALALHPDTLRVLDRAGFAGNLVAQGYRLDSLAFYDGGERRAEIELGRLGTDFSFVLVLPQQALEDALEERLGKKKVKVQWNHRLGRLELEGDRVRATVQRLGKESTGYSYSTTGWVVEKEYDVDAAFVVGADGHKSIVRRALDIDFPDLGGAQCFGVFEFAADADLEHEVRVVLDDATTNVLWPLGDGRFRWSFELEPQEEVPDRVKGRLAVQVGDDAFAYLDEEKLAELIAERAPWFTAEVSDVQWSVEVRFERRLAARFGHGRAWLAGDSAHLATPLGVHSMNVGLREGRDLAERLAAILGHGGQDSGGALEAYNDERTREWRRLLGVDGRVEAGANASPWVRKRAARIAPNVPASGPDLESLVGQLGLELR